jgi:hypothetical protein
MPMVKAVLIAQLANVLSETTSGGQPISANAKAQAIADIIDAYIRTATVTVNVTGVGVCGVGGGPVTGTGIGTLS